MFNRQQAAPPVQVYCPQEAHPASFAALGDAGWLAGTARLAHRLHAPRLLQGLEAYIQGEWRGVGKPSHPRSCCTVHGL